MAFKRKHIDFGGLDSLAGAYYADQEDFTNISERQESCVLPFRRSTGIRLSDEHLFED